MPSIEWLAAVDPNIVYLGLIVALWSVVTIVYSPGTIIGEIFSAVLTLAALVMLANMPTNWLAVILIVVGVSGFLALPFVSIRFARFADLGLLMQVAGGMMLFREGPQVSPVIVLATVLVAWVYHRFVLMPALRLHAKTAKADEGHLLVGMRGRVTRAIDPIGTVYVNGESWTARSPEPLDVNTEVVVVRKAGLELFVEKAKREEEVRVNGFQH
ncbi:NfeD family protein [Aggregatilineales bacterium SYSU G02658]